MFFFAVRYSGRVEERVTVVAGVMERCGKILICRRRADGWHPLKWEFPGGKAEPGEEPPAALARELQEELGIQATIGREITRYGYAYPERKPILLIFCEVKEWNGEPMNLDFAEILWERRKELPGYDFVEGDVEFVGRLARGEI